MPSRILHLSRTSPVCISTNLGSGNDGNQSKAPFVIWQRSSRIPSLPSDSFYLLSRVYSLQWTSIGMCEKAPSFLPACRLCLLLPLLLQLVPVEHTYLLVCRISLIYFWDIIASSPRTNFHCLLGKETSRKCHLHSKSLDKLHVIILPIDVKCASPCISNGER